MFKITEKKAKIIFITAVIIIGGSLLLNLIFWFTGMPKAFFEYSITEKNTVSIDGYKAPFLFVSIPGKIDGKNVTEIGDLSFEALNYISSDHFYITYLDPRVHLLAVRIPDTVESIHSLAFANQSSLFYINMPSSLKNTGWYILRDTAVTTLTFPEGITEIGTSTEDEGFDIIGSSEAFASMPYLRKIVLPESLKRIGNNAFCKARSLREVTLPEGVETIDYGAFQDSGLEKINIPEGLKNIAGGTFFGTPFDKQLEEQTDSDFIILNGDILYKYIGDDENVMIPDGTTRIAARAFWNTKIKTAVIPESVESIGANAFYNCRSLREVNIQGSSTIEETAFEGCTSLKNIPS